MKVIKGDQLNIQGDQLNMQGEQLSIQGDQLNIQGDQLNTCPMNDPEQQVGHFVQASLAPKNNNLYNNII